MRPRGLTVRYLEVTLLKTCFESLDSVPLMVATAKRAFCLALFGPQEGSCSWIGW